MANVEWDMDLLETVGMKVVVVDDDPVHLHTMTQTLQRAGYQVTVKASPAEALREVEENPDGVDFIITAARTRGPGIDGVELAQRIGRSYAIILLFSGDESLEMTRRGCANGYLITKPLYENAVFIIWQHIVRWRRRCAAGNGSSGDVQPEDTSRKRGAVVNDSDQGGSHGGLHLGTTKKTKVVNAANQPQQTEEDTPNNIGEFMELDGLNVPSDQVRSHLQKYRSNCPTGPLSTIPSSSTSHSNSSSKNYPASQHNEGSFRFHMRSEGPTDINQTSWLSGGASPVDFGVLGNGDNTTNLGGGADYGHGYHLGNGNAGLGGVLRSENMVSASQLPSNLAQPVQHGMHADRVAVQISAVQTPNLDNDFMNWDNYIFETAGTSGGGGVVTDGAIDGPTMDEFEKFMNEK